MIEDAGFVDMAQAHADSRAMPADVHEAVVRSKSQVEPAFYWKGKIHFSLENIIGPEDIARAVAHEVIHLAEAAYVKRLVARIVMDEVSRGREYLAWAGRRSRMP